MRACVWHIDSFHPSHLQAADWHYSQKIYKHLVKEKNLSLNAWSIFQQAFPNEKGLDHNHAISVPSERGSNPIELPSIQKWLVAIPFSHIVALDIRGLCLRFEHLMLLTGVQNLGALFLQRPQRAFSQDLDDKSMRDWCRVVQEKKAFTRLKVVGFHHFAPSWEASLKCLAGFPALRICAVEPFKSVPMSWPRDGVEELDLPFEVIPEDGSLHDPGYIWSRENTPGELIECCAACVVRYFVSYIFSKYSFTWKSEITTPLFRSISLTSKLTPHSPHQNKTPPRPSRHSSPAIPRLSLSLCALRSGA